MLTNRISSSPGKRHKNRNHFAFHYDKKVVSLSVVAIALSLSLIASINTFMPASRQAEVLVQEEGFSLPPTCKVGVESYMFRTVCNNSGAEDFYTYIDYSCYGENSLDQAQHTLGDASNCRSMYLLYKDADADCQRKGNNTCIGK